jgi:hypothetical protein
MMRFMQIGDEAFPTPGIVVDSAGIVVTPPALLSPAAFSIEPLVSLLKEEQQQTLI